MQWDVVEVDIFIKDMRSTRKKGVVVALGK